LANIPQLPAGLTDPSRPCNIVTGALGFVGRHLVRSLTLAGLPVVGLDQVPLDSESNTGLPQKVGSFELQPKQDGQDHFRAYSGPAGTWFYCCCPLDAAPPHPEQLIALMTTLQPTMVYHLAAQSSAAHSFNDPGGTLDTNINGTLNLLEAVRAVPLGKRPVMLSVGSCEEYGPQPKNRYPLEEDAPLNPISPYAVSKVAQTLLCRQYVRAWDLPVIMVRSFSHTGPGQDARFAFPAFARQIAAAEAGQGPAKISVGNLSSERDFLHVGDVVDAYRLLMKEGRPGEIYNVCSGQSLTMDQGLQIMLAESSCKMEIITDKARLRPADTPMMIGNNTKLVNDTGWAPEWDITQTLRDLLNEARREFR